MIITNDDRKKAKEVFVNYFRQTKTDEEIFYQLCFCLCTPQTTFKNNTIVIEHLKNLNYYFKNISQSKLEELCKPVRFYRNKAKWLAEMKEKFIDITYTVRSNFTDYVKRDALVKSVKGLGWKTASHFLRNLGATDLAIIDTHVLKFLGVEGRSGTFKESYIDLEDQFRKIANKKKLSVAELDIIVWKKYSNTSWENYVY